MSAQGAFRRSSKAGNRRRLLGGCGLRGAGGLLLAACGGSKDEGSSGSSSSSSASGAATAGAAPAAKKEPVRGGTLTFPLGGDPPNLDMHSNPTYLVNNSMAPVYNQLIQFDPDVAIESPKPIVGDLAKSWEQSGDGLTYTFKLNDGVTFHDGKPFGSADVKASLERMASPPKGLVSPRQDSLAVI